MEENKTMEKYAVEVKCKNCKRINWINGIPQGKTVEDHCLDLGGICKICGCELFKEKEEKEENINEETE